jgi:hypothetical protein
MKMAVFWGFARAVWQKSTDVSEELTGSIIRMMSHLESLITLIMETVSSSETSVNLYQTTRATSQKTAIFCSLNIGGTLSRR